ncbi:uncharacterized protein CCOS01_07925 [Colletotrichum costaricense]|uniref:Uncharacterized protein n=1 Tax=Colletotrichum costaricense TaxID=1209916 RepID=A0AAI9YXT2_9PEZI|nr:uncharacterized protein CCOS01_07925 [Colletotrichum costaricense]KAK1527663.1 hypothetical protein CCOS01_07925 [Colletotrichum costaricense]
MVLSDGPWRLAVTGSIVVDSLFLFLFLFLCLPISLSLIVHLGITLLESWREGSSRVGYLSELPRHTRKRSMADNRHHEGGAARAVTLRLRGTIPWVISLSVSPPSVPLLCQVTQAKGEEVERVRDRQLEHPPSPRSPVSTSSPPVRCSLWRPRGVTWTWTRAVPSCLDGAAVRCQ